MAKVSIIIPSRNERFLSQTVTDIFTHATGDIEILVNLDGYWQNPPLPDDKRLTIIHRGVAKGMRAGINACAAIAKGKYLLKTDAHCSFAEGFDEVLQSECEDNWIVVPRRLSLNGEEWKPNPKESIDYEHIFYPLTEGHEPGLHARPWLDRGRQRRDVLLDEDMSWQGSFWFMTLEHFHKRLGGMSEEGYGIFMGEPQELGFKTQLGPWEGKLMRNKKTWIAHLHKGRQYGRGYSMGDEVRKPGNAYSFDFWWNNRWTERKHDIEWLFDKFWPLPGWPDNWREVKNGNA
jgi:hypothetical protein